MGRSWKLKAAMSAVALCVAAELGLRGILGCTPLSVTHPTIEYMFAPNQQCVRFGNEVFINEYGMRSPSLSQTKPEDELRVLILGDSVVNGGNSIDQAELATTLIQKSLSEELTRQVVVMNVSAGSWGPANLLAYVEKYGTFDADIAVVVLSTHDYADVPTFAPLNPNTHPTQAPRLAVWEAITRYLPQLVARLYPSGKVDIPQWRASPETIRQSVTAFRQLASRLDRLDRPLFFLLHATQSEVAQDHYDDAASVLLDSAGELNMVILRDRQAMKAAGTIAYRDNIHLSPEGQKVLGELLSQALRETTRRSSEFKPDLPTPPEQQ